MTTEPSNKIRIMVVRFRVLVFNVCLFFLEIWHGVSSDDPWVTYPDSVAQDYCPWEWSELKVLWFDHDIFKKVKRTATGSKFNICGQKAKLTLQRKYFFKLNDDVTKIIR